jgi:putative nucleotidyltransferase with HDIG domain
MLNILLLEDQPAVRNVMLEVIKEVSRQANVACASSLKEARELLMDVNWQAMVADLTLGDGQSLDLIAELRKQGNDIPVILVSGFLTADRMQQAKQLGVNVVLHKPFHPKALQAGLRKLLGTTSRAPEPENAAPANTLQGKLLPEMFEMDRNLGLLFRMLNEIPQHKDVVQICSSALSLAMDMVQTNRGFMALFERGQEQFVMVTHQGTGESDSMQTVAPSCALATTPFGPLLDKGEEFIHLLPEHHDGQACWPEVSAKDYIAVPLRLQGIPMGVLCLLDCQGKGALSDRLKYMLRLLMTHLDTLLDNCAVHAALGKSMKETLIALVRSLEARDKYTKDHSARVSKMAVYFAGKLGLDEETIALVRTGGLLHDIGKTGVPDSVLLKPGRFTNKEYAIIKTHPAIGDSILRNMDTLALERQIVRHHHERMDGHGYPDKLKGEGIPLIARIVCVADAIDAMTTHRVYRQARPLSFCIEQLRQNSGTQFDTQVVEVAIAAIEEGHVNTQAIPEHDDFGDVLPAFLPAYAKS